MTNIVQPNLFSKHMFVIQEADLEIVAKQYNLNTMH